jgi:protein-S-isoprenylcysteine O-methyltransferase Ste14
MLFAGFIFPLVVFFVVDDSITKGHAKKAFISHLFPLFPVPLLVAGIFYDISRGENVFPVYTISCAVVTAIIGIVVLIWNIVKGVKVLVQK